MPPESGSPLSRKASGLVPKCNPTDAKLKFEHFSCESKEEEEEEEVDTLVDVDKVAVTCSDLSAGSTKTTECFREVPSSCKTMRLSSGNAVSSTPTDTKDPIPRDYRVQDDTSVVVDVCNDGEHVDSNTTMIESLKESEAQPGHEVSVLCPKRNPADTKLASSAIFSEHRGESDTLTDATAGTTSEGVSIHSIGTENVSEKNSNETNQTSNRPHTTHGTQQTVEGVSISDDGKKPQGGIGVDNYAITDSVSDVKTDGVLALPTGGEGNTRFSHSCMKNVLPSSRTFDAKFTPKDFEGEDAGLECAEVGKNSSRESVEDSVPMHAEELEVDTLVSDGIYHR